MAGDVGLAAVMDVSLSIDTAMFGFKEVRVGVAPAIISVVWLPTMRRADAQSVFLRWNRFSAGEAQWIGLIYSAVTARDLDGEITTVLNDLLAGEPHAIAVAKQLTIVVPSLSVDEAFAWTTKQAADLLHSDEAREGMTAFLDMRPASPVRWVPTNDAD